MPFPDGEGVAGLSGKTPLNLLQTAASGCSSQRADHSVREQDPVHAARAREVREAGANQRPSAIVCGEAGTGSGMGLSGEGGCLAPQADVLFCPGVNVPLSW